MVTLSEFIEANRNNIRQQSSLGGYDFSTFLYKLRTAAAHEIKSFQLIYAIRSIVIPAHAGI